MGLRTALGLKRKKPGQPAPAWMAGKDFTRTWALQHFEVWDQVLSPFAADVREILEIGSWEGLSALYFLHAFPAAHITCVDTFAGSREHNDPASPTFTQRMEGVEARFDKNLSGHHARMTKIKCRSIPALDAFAVAEKRFDLIYIDGSHRRDDVFADSALAWPLLKTGGAMIWDDYMWRPELPPAERPQPAIDLFSRAFAPCIEVVHGGHQRIIRKTCDWPA
jgi:hypothetical protein